MSLERANCLLWVCAMEERAELVEQDQAETFADPADAARRTGRNGPAAVARSSLGLFNGCVLLP